MGLIYSFVALGLSLCCGHVRSISDLQFMTSSAPQNASRDFRFTQKDISSLLHAFHGENSEHNV